MASGTVLIVDDDAAIVEVMTLALESEGYAVLSEVGEAVLHCAAKEQPDVILLDLMMPAPDGAELCRRLSADPTTAHIPIVLISAAVNLGAMARLLPVHGQLAKPFDLDDLYATVAHWSAQGHHVTA